MSIDVYHANAVARCLHVGTVVTVPIQQRVKVSGMLVATIAARSTVVACPFAIGVPPKPQPCVTVEWLLPATRVKVLGNPVLLKTSTGICRSIEQIPQGPPTVVSTQTRVKAM